MPDDKDKQEGHGTYVPGQQAAEPTGIMGFFSKAYDAVKGFILGGGGDSGHTAESARRSVSGGAQPTSPLPGQGNPQGIPSATIKAGPSDMQLLSAGMAGVSAIASSAYHAVKDVVAPDRPRAMEEGWLNPRIRSVAVTNLHLEMEVDGKIRRFEISPATEARLRSGEVTPNELANMALDKLDAAQRRASMNFEMGRMGQDEGIGMSQSLRR